MKKLIFPMLILGVGVVLYEQNLASPNLYIRVFGIVLFMFAMMKLSSKTTSKKDEENDTEI